MLKIYLDGDNLRCAVCDERLALIIDEQPASIEMMDIEEHDDCEGDRNDD